MTRRYTQIKDLSTRRRLPRLGKIRLGIKVENGDKPYPKETPYFVVPQEVAKVYGDRPTELDIMLPVEDESVCFPQAYEFYGSSRGLKCTGDGETAMRLNEQTKVMEQRECPCELFEQKKCKQRAHLAVILHKVSVGGIYQIDTSSFNSIVDLNSSIDYVRALIGRFAMVPLKLKREARETHHDGMKQIHYTLRIELEGNVDFVNTLRENTSRVLSGPSFSLPPPIQENPEMDDGATVEAGTAEASESSTVLIHEGNTYPEAGPAPAETDASVGALLASLEQASGADHVNAVLDLSKALTTPEDRATVRKAAAKRMKELMHG